MPQRSILLVAHVTPPTTMSAARRAAGLTRYLAAAGHRVTVLTSMMGGSGPVPGAARTVRTRDLMTSRLNWRREGLAAIQGESSAAAPPAPSVLARWTVPDLQIVGWEPFALPRALSLVRTERPDCVITTSPPHSAHVTALALSLRGIPWVADFRDGWTFESLRPPWAAPGLGALDGALERLVVTRADAVSAVTEPIAEDLRSRLCRPVQTITNGFDPGDEGVAASARAERDHGPRVLVHTGTLAFGGRPIGPLIAGLLALRGEVDDLPSRLRVRLIGPCTDAERSQIQDAKLDDVVELPGSLDHDAAIAAQRDADGLLVITGPRQRGVATGKLYEYLSHGLPIIVIGDDTAAADIVRRTKAGVAVDRESPAELAAALRTLVTRPQELPRPSSEAVAEFTYPVLAEQMAALVETAIDHRGGRASR